MAVDTYYHVSRGLISSGQHLHGFDPVPKLLEFMFRTFGKGLDHVETAMLTDGLVYQFLSNELGFFGPFKLALQEAILEIERAENFPDLPSRVGSPQLFRTLNAARLFCRRYDSPYDRRLPGYIHECNIVSGDPFHTYMDWTSGGGGRGTIENIVNAKREYAARYWRADVPEHPEFPEALVQGQAVVLRLLEVVDA